MRYRFLASVALAFPLLVALPVRAADVPADPSDYKQKFAQLVPGDVLKLAPGDYGPLQIVGVNGQPNMPITIEGPASGPPARFLGNACCNTIDITDSSYITIRNLLLDGQDIPGIDAIKAGGASAANYSHHITIEGCTITRHDGGQTSQQTVGISTKIVSWDWVVRGNLIDGAGTGMYFGNSDGTRAFIGGLVEHNLFRSALGYNMEIKHQLDRQQADVPFVPMEPRVTIIRHNVFIKKNLPSPDGVRPNLLVDGFPDSGPGSSDHYEIYGNFFYHNDTEALLQVSGRVHIHDNVFVDSLVAGMRVMDHEGKTVIDGIVYNNTIYDTGVGIGFSNAPTGTSLVAGNAIFSATPLSGMMTGAYDNVTGPVSAAASHVVNPSKTLGIMDFYPSAGSPLKGAPIDLASVNADIDYQKDFNGVTKDFTYRGAYTGEGTNPGWTLDDDFKDIGSGGTGGGTTGSGGGTGAGGGTSSNGAGAGAATSGAGGGVGAGGGATTGGAAPSGNEGSCGCRVAGTDSRGPSAASLLALLSLVALVLRANKSRLFAVVVTNQTRALISRPDP